jgi:hypothetical protein
MIMKRVALLANVTLALAIGAATAIAQVQQKGPDDKAGGQAQQKNQGQERAKRAEPEGKGAAQSKEQPGRGAAQTEPKGKTTKGAAEKGIEPKDKATKGAAEKAVAPKDKTTKGATEKGVEPKDKAPKGTAEKGVEPKDETTKGVAEKGAAGRVQLSEQQRSSVGQTILKEQRVNRVTKPNFSVNVGTRVPRSVRLIALPISVVSIVPAYRSYRYFVVDEQVCIVDPATYETVEIVTVSDQTARTDRGTPATIVLTEEEKAIILSGVDTRSGGSTLGLGALTEGADVPRGVQLRVFPDAVVRKVPKVMNYRFFTVEDRIAIVDPKGAKVQLVIGEQR